jgi:chitodextrinase
MHQSTVFVSPFLFLLLIMNVLGATSVSFNNTTIIARGALTASVSAVPNPVSAGQPVSLTCAATGGTPPYSYSWTLGDGSTGTGSILTHTYITTGTKTVVCTVTDNVGISANGSTTVSVV